MLSQKASDHIGQWAHIVEPVAKNYCIDPNLMAAVLWHESQGQAEVPLSVVGAVGMFQIMPSDNSVRPDLSMPFRPTSEWLSDPMNNARYAARILVQVYTKVKNWKETLALYNCGEVNLLAGTCGKGGGWDYARSVLATYGQWRYFPPEPELPCLRWC